MSLEELRAQVEEEEAKAKQPEAEEEPEEVEAEEPETEEEESEEPEQEVAEESDDFELELEGESTPSQQSDKPDPVEVLKFKLSRKNRQKKEAETENESLKREIEELKSLVKGGGQQQQPNPQSQPGANYPPVPLLYEEYKGEVLNDRDQYNRAYQDWMRECREVDQRHSQAEQVQTQHKERIDKLTRNLAESVSKFATQEKIKPEYVADAVNSAADKFDELTGLDGAFLEMMDAVGDGSERVAIYLGKNEKAMSKIAQLYNEDPRGFRVVRQMTEWKKDLKRKHSKQVSKAPEPDPPLRGDSSKNGKSASKLQAEWNKAKTTDEMMKVRRKAREMGVKLDI